MEKGNLGTASNMGVCFATNYFAVPRVLAVGRPCLDLVDSSSYSASPFEITVLAAKNVWIVCVLVFDLELLVRIRLCLRS